MLVVRQGRVDIARSDGEHLTLHVGQDRLLPQVAGDAAELDGFGQGRESPVGVAAEQGGPDQSKERPRALSRL